MLKCIRRICFVLCLFYGFLGGAQSSTTHRTPEFTNDKVRVWKTIIYPTSKEKLSMHRHDHDRIVVALTSGVLNVTDNKGRSHVFTLEKGRSYYLKKDPVNELHIDENMTNHPISVVVIELK